MTDRMDRTSDMGSTDGYAAEADEIAVRYERISFADLHRETLPLFPPPPAHAIDIGAGTGRDAAALARLGYRVTAIEPVNELRAHAQRLHADVVIDWRADALPELAAVRAAGVQGDLLLLTAVWMHLDASERARGMAALAAITATGGRVAMSLRHGPVPPGRRMFEVSAAETFALGASHGLRRIAAFEQADSQGRQDVTWTFLVMERPRP